MTGCPSIAYIVADGREVAMIPCQLEAGHDEPTPIWAVDVPVELRRVGVVEPMRYLDPEPHAHTLTWTNPEGMLDSWPEYADPDESFDLEVDIEPDAVNAATCPGCGILRSECPGRWSLEGECCDACTC